MPVRDRVERLNRPSYDPATGTYVLDRDYDEAFPDVRRAPAPSEKAATPGEPNAGEVRRRQGRRSVGVRSRAARQAR